MLVEIEEKIKDKLTINGRNCYEFNTLELANVALIGYITGSIEMSDDELSFAVANASSLMLDIAKSHKGERIPSHLMRSRPFYKSIIGQLGFL